MNKRHAYCVVALVTHLASACSGADFGGSDPVASRARAPKDDHSASADATGPDGGNKLAGTSAAAPAEGRGEQGEPDEQDEPPEAMTATMLTSLLAGDPNAQALAGCLAGWGDQTGLTADAVKNYRTMTATGTGFSNHSINDSTNTKKPSLVLIESDDVGFSNLDLKLGNPNGFYCLKITSTGFSSVAIKKHCRAVIGSDSRDNVGFADSKIEEFGDDCG